KVRYILPYFPNRVRKIDFKFPGMSCFSLHHIASFNFSHKAVKKNEFDIIIANCQYSSFAACNIKKYCGIPFLLLVWDPSTFTARKIYKRRIGWKYPILYLCAKLLDKFSLAKCEAVITSGKFHHSYFKKLTNKPLEILVPGCFAKEIFPDFSKRKRNILTYDRWDIGNDPIIFLDILERLHAKDVNLIVGGFWHPINLSEKFKYELKRRGLENRVELLGPLDEKMIIDLCSTSMVHVHPVHEAFGMQSLEAAACGCPIIIPNGSGVSDLFKHGVHGYFPEDNSVGEFVKYIDMIFNDAKKSKEMSMRAWECAKNYTWEGYAQKLVKICRRYIHE
ncbi:MAG: glycosyltransferase family 4 protein, partial [Candidatus Omnitrophica bacterium]|nr:glycosyltransferase family 4 protein [Candidatus Omnitrophota bacterium]